MISLTSIPVIPHEARRDYYLLTALHFELEPQVHRETISLFIALHQVINNKIYEAYFYSACM